MYRNKLNDKADLIWIKQYGPTAASNVSYDNGICIKIYAIAKRDRDIVLCYLYV